MIDSKKENNITITPSKYLYTVLIVLGLFFWLIHLLLDYGDVKKVYKKKLVTYYKSDKKTIGKWVKHFCDDLIDYQIYKQKRKLDNWTYSRILRRLGSPNNFPILTKREIIRRADGSYTSLRKSIEAYPEKFGISIDVFRQLNKFPPSLSLSLIHI